MKNYDHTLESCAEACGVSTEIMDKVLEFVKSCYVRSSSFSQCVEYLDKATQVEGDAGETMKRALILLSVQLIIRDAKRSEARDQFL